MIGLKLNHVTKRGPGDLAMRFVQSSAVKLYALSMYDFLSSSNLMEIHIAVTRRGDIRWLHMFAHITTTEPLYHVQNVVAIMY